jgi:hypothetical protein
MVTENLEGKPKTGDNAIVLLQKLMFLGTKISRSILDLPEETFIIDIVSRNHNQTLSSC